MAVHSDFDANVDLPRNLLRLRFAGDFTPAEMKIAAGRIETMLPSLKPGFSLLADFGAVSSMELDCVPHLTRVMDLCRAHQIGLIVRVLPPPQHDIGINLLALVHYRGEVRTVTADDLAGAERALR